MALGPWVPMPNAIHPGSEIRHEIAQMTVVGVGTVDLEPSRENVVLTLYPEYIRDGSGRMAWAWAVHTACHLPQRYGITFGGNLDKEVARAQAEAAARNYGYEF